MQTMNRTTHLFIFSVSVLASGDAVKSRLKQLCRSVQSFLVEKGLFEALKVCVSPEPIDLQHLPP